MEDPIRQIILLFLFSLSSCVGYSKIDHLYKKAQFQEAYALLQKQAKNSTKYHSYELKLALQLVILGDKNYFPLLEEALKRPIPLGMENVHAFALTWLLYMQAQNNADFKKVLEQLPTQALKDKTLEKARLAIHAQILIKLERYSEVEHILTHNTGTSTELIYLLASAYKGLEKNKQALNLYKEVLRISTSSLLKGLVYYQCGEIYVKMKNTKKAKEAYTHSWLLASNNAALNFKLGRLLSEDGYENLPERFYRAALRLDENHAEAWYYLNLQ